MADVALARPAADPPSSSRPRRLLRRHWLFSLLFLAGVTMRVIVSVAYRPAFIYFDSIPYLANAQRLTPQTTRPAGYPVLLRGLLWIHDLTAVIALQHLMGLIIAVLIYTVLLRFGAPAWGAALGAAPILLDAYQLNIEHYIMSDTTSEFLIALALAVLVWRRAGVGLIAAGLAGLLIGMAVWVRSETLVMVVPTALYVLLRERTWMRRLQRVIALGLCCIIPVLGYASWYHSAHDKYALSGQTGKWLYGRVAPFADCSKLDLEKALKPLCPANPPKDRIPSNCFVWCSFSPAITFTPPEGETRDEALRKFSLQVIKHQPWDYLKHAAADVLYGFRPTHAIRPKDVSNGDSKFSAKFPSQAQEPPAQVVRRYGNDGTHVIAPLGRFMQGYQKVVYVPGTLLAVLMIIGFLGAFGIGRARHSGLRAPCLLFALGGLLIVIPAALVSEFVWRYQLPQSIMLPMAGVLGLTAMLRKRPPVAPEVPNAYAPVAPQPTLPSGF